MAKKYWLMKAEPDSRFIKGKDVKFSVDDFEFVKTTAWEGVRNAEARNLIKDMKLGDKVLFYHSNCKNPGIAAVAEVSKEAYPDYTAWDPSHPYYDQKTDQTKPKWYMVDVTFKFRLAHFVPLSLLKGIASGSCPDGPGYVGNEGVQAIKAMALVTRGRLSVQKVEPATYDILVQMGQRGGWEGEGDRPSRSQPRTTTKTKSKKAAGSSGGGVDGSVEGSVPMKQKRGRKKGPVAALTGEGGIDEGSEPSGNPPTGRPRTEGDSTKTRGRKRKAREDAADSEVTLRRSTRAKR